MCQTVQQGWTVVLADYYWTCFMDEQTEAQKRLGNLPTVMRLGNEKESGLEPRSLCFRESCVIETQPLEPDCLGPNPGSPC